jgi:hypothetical protein
LEEGHDESQGLYTHRAADRGGDHRHSGGNRDPEVRDHQGQGESAQEAYFSDNPTTYAAAAATLQAAPYNFTFSAGNAVTASAGDATGYSITVQNASISTGTNSCQVTVGMGAAAAVDGVIQCP